MPLPPHESIVTALHGGLGNQLFQYSVARALAHRLQVPLYLDTRFYKNNSFRAYLLDKFNHTGKVLHNYEQLPEPVGWAKKAARTMGLISGTEIMKRIDGHESHAFDPRLWEVSPGTFLHGWWFSERYFSDIGELLREELKFLEDASGENADLIERVAATHSVSVHIRRGDYVSNANVAAGMAKCSLDYYIRAANFIEARTARAPVFYVFSDDISWCRENLKLPGKMIFLDGNGEEHCHEDLRLMSQCKHHIIANSTFSWWGAWLNSNPKKIVVAPKRWITSSKYFDLHICPNSFSTIEN